MKNLYPFLVKSIIGERIISIIADDKQKAIKEVSQRNPNCIINYFGDIISQEELKDAVIDLVEERPIDLVEQKTEKMPIKSFKASLELTLNEMGKKLTKTDKKDLKRIIKKL